MTPQPEALRLAEYYECATDLHSIQTAAELRRLSAENERLREKYHTAIKQAITKRTNELLAQRDDLLALLGNIRGWDMLDATADGVYWKREIDASIRAVENT